MAEQQQRENCQDESVFSRTKEWFGNKEEVTFIWLTRTSFDTENCDGEITRKGLCEISSCVKICNELTRFVEILEETKRERIFLLVDGKLFANIYETALSYRAVDSIYIFCRIRAKYETSEQKPKVKGIFINRTSLFNALYKDIQAVEKQILAFSRLKQQRHVLTKDLSQESASFFWFMLLFDVLKAMPQATEDERTTMLNICADYYRDNEPFLKDIKDFHNTYTADKALSWYTRSSFIYKLVNKALRVEDVELLYQFRFYIIDLCTQLEQQWYCAKSKGLTEIRSIVFRGGKLACTEMDLLTPGHIITTNGFLSTTRNIDVAHMFVRNSITDNLHHCAVIFYITIPENLTSLIFVDVDNKDTTYCYENEVLFSIGARFRIDTVYADNNHIYHIEMTATDDGCEDVNAYREVLQRHLNEAKPSFVFGRLLLDMGQRQKAKSYFQYLLRTTSTNNHLDVANIYGYLGRIARENGCFDEALFHHTRALQICNEHLQLIHEQRASLLDSLGLDYYSKSDLRTALNHLYRSIDMKIKLYGENGHTHIARVSGHIALIFQQCGDFKLALEYLRRAVSIEQRFLPREHIYIAFRFENLASLYVCQKKYALALVYYLQALSIVKRILPVYHDKYVLILNGIKKALNHLVQ